MTRGLPALRGLAGPRGSPKAPGTPRPVRPTPRSPTRGGEDEVPCSGAWPPAPCWHPGTGPGPVSEPGCSSEGLKVLGMEPHNKKSHLDKKISVCWGRNVAMAQGSWWRTAVTGLCKNPALGAQLQDGGRAPKRGVRPPGGTVLFQSPNGKQTPKPPAPGADPEALEPPGLL